jgi:hypothetical protein
MVWENRSHENSVGGHQQVSMKYTYICKKNNTTRDLDVVVIKKDTKKMALRRVWPMDKEIKRQRGDPCRPS